MVSTPQAPDPKATADAQSGMNRDTATQQQMLNMTDQVNPYGKVSYNQIGNTSYTDSQGKTINVPRFQQTTEFTPEQQAIFNKSQEAQTNIAGLAAEQSAKLKEYLNTPFEFNNKDAENWAYDLAASRMDPRFKQQEQQLEADMINRGIRPGTQAYDMQKANMGQQKNDAYNQLMLNGRQQAFSEALAKRNQPLNEISALLSGSQVSNPAQMSGNTPQTNVGGVDYTGLVNQKYQADLQNSQAKMGALGGLFGLLGRFSDRRLKRGVRRVGMLDNGLPVYAYQYVWGGPVQIGLMADEVAEVAPDAVALHPSGFAMVDYGKAA